jgi:tellurite resistance protein TerC
MSVDVWVWPAFVAFVVAVLTVDLLVFHRRADELSLRAAAMLSAFWISLGLGFGVLVWAWQGPSQASAYYASYLLEKALSVDNVFVFALVLGYFAIPARLQHRVLFLGVIGAIAMRAVFIVGGLAILDTFHWVIYALGVILIVTGIRMAARHSRDIRPERNRALWLLSHVVPITRDDTGTHFLVRRRGVLMATPLLAALVVLEVSDLIFAVDSVPAVFAITRDPFIVLTSNVFAILGLRALYFLLASSMRDVRYLQTGLAVVLVCVGGKMLASPLYEVPVGVSLGVIATILAIAVGASLPGRHKRSGANTTPTGSMPREPP